VWVTGIGSMMTVHFTPAPPRTAAEADAADPQLRELLFFDLLERGIHVARRGMVALSLPVGDAECGALADAFGAFLADRAPLLG
jgi:glutamate-1-semialdehyde 2,1-aminomutase